MSEKYYMLRGANDVNLRHTFIASLPDELQPELHRAINALHRNMADISIGEIYQLALATVDNLCEQQKFFKGMLKGQSKLRHACKKPHLKIKCKDDKDCSCSTKRKSHYRRFRYPKGSYSRRRSRKPFLRYFKRRKPYSKKSDRCYVCKKKGHFAKNCPNKTKKDVKMLEHLQTVLMINEDEDIESVIEEQDAQNEETQYVLPFSEDEEFDSESLSQEDDDPQGYLYSLEQPVHPSSFLGSLASQPDHNKVTPKPNVKIHILPGRYEKPIPVIAFIDTGACRTIMNPDILPSEAWIPCDQFFLTANSKPFKIEWITRRKIGIQFFPGCVLWMKVLGSDLPGKDILIGFDTYYHTRNLQIQQAPPGYEDIRDHLLKFCADSHQQFSHPFPLWKNQEFFIKLPFKKNEDISPTKASHPGMNPEDLKLAKEECAALLKQGLIELTKSNWACQAFYVEKRSEIKRGKKRLVIDYKPLNIFLQDDKFPLLKPSSLTVHLKDAKIFSKFDLKAGFWQLGIHPEDRPKIALCIPNAQYQWTVMPFGLKAAPSLFQKAMTRIFEPMLDNLLIYIDDLLLFSKDEDSHKLLLTQFGEIIEKYGIMLSAKKGEIGVKSIEFLGMHFENGQYYPGPHIIEELLKFPDDNLTTKQIQQFLGIINYLRDFIPHVSNHTSQLSKLLKKNPPAWGTEQTSAVKTLKRIAQQPPPLKIPDKGLRILQTDASDDFWGAVLIEEIDGKRFYCGHASGQFKESEKHYHATYKEILAIKRGIEKFSFHLSPYQFRVEMDNTSFPRMLDPKGKTLPDSQLLRWKDWFSRYKFTVHHLKGHQNIIADFLTRPQKVSQPPKLLSLSRPQPLFILTISEPEMPHRMRATIFPPGSRLESLADVQKLDF
ncbi:uncharacterized protein LOC114754141 [Neltuma alba]|uniref:uncharacterized protein LOC114754141 n=1 Tax=Neltuma alba TaxID=207710 RepID=UPI0010A4E0D3|nr:uncharacterized protein LOC114754141 [Prosopis alba]